jgi:protein SCO1/2
LTPWRVVVFLLWASSAAAQSPLPFALGGSFSLTDQHSNARTEKDPNGHAQLLFFGYVNCPDICTAALPLMADVTNQLNERGHKVTPVMVTVDPDRDRVNTMAAPLAKWHPDFIGLTGDHAALNEAYEAFSVEIKPIFEDPEYGWIYAHGSFIYLLDWEGEVLSLIPPTLGTEQVVDIVAKYLDPIE